MPARASGPTPRRPSDEGTRGGSSSPGGPGTPDPCRPQPRPDGPQTGSSGPQSDERSQRPAGQQPPSARPSDAGWPPPGSSRQVEARPLPLKTAGLRKGRRPLDPRRRRRRRAGAAVLALIVLLAVAGLVLGGYAAYRQFTLGYVFSAPPPGASVAVSIPKGATLHQIGDILQSSHVVPSGGAFVSRAEADGYSARFQPGTYELRQYDNYDDIIKVLVLTASAPSDKVTFPEGYTARQMGVAAARAIPDFSGSQYVDLTLKHPLPYTVPGMKPGTSLEGLLFPATYEFPPLTTPKSLIDLQYKMFRNAMGRIDLTKARQKNLTAYDIVIIASMIEREVRVPAERRLVSAVIWNRLRLDMPLQIDATLLYGLGTGAKTLTEADLKRDTPYNTYLHRGLPPTPICNPGAASLKAAADPAAVGYLYYVVRNDGTGRHRFSSEYDQFLRDKAKAGL